MSFLKYVPDNAFIFSLKKKEGVLRLGHYIYHTLVHQNQVIINQNFQPLDTCTRQIQIGKKS